MDIGKIKSMKEKLANINFLKDVAVTMIGQIVVMLVAFGLNKVVSNTVSVEDFGVYNLIRRAANVLVYVMLAAMGIAVPKYLAEYTEKKDCKNVALYTLASLLIVLILSTIVGIAVVLLSGPVNQLVFGGAEYKKYILPIALYAASSTLCTYSHAYYRGIGDFRRYSTHQITVQILVLLVAVVAQGNLTNIIWGWCLVYSTFSLIVLAPQIGRKLKDVRGAEKAEVCSAISTLLRYGLPRVPGEFVLFAYSLLPLSVVMHKFGMEQSSYFSSAVSITTMVTPLFSFVGLVLLPMASKSVVNNDTAEVNKGLKMLGVLYITLSLLAIGLIELLPELVVSILFSKEYYAAIPVIRIVIISLLPNAIYLLLRNPIDGISSIPYNTYSLLISFTVTLVTMWSAPDIYVCAWAYVAGYAVMGILSFIFWVIALKKINHNKEGNEA